jgi:cation-transporting ATPase E
MSSPHSIKGLTTQEVEARRAAGKSAASPLPTGRTYEEIIREDVFALVNVVLYVLCLALLLLGQVSEALVASAAVLFNAVTSTVQEVRAKRTLDRIALLTRPKATVLRDGQEQSVDPGEVVQGDVLVLHPGDQIVVDGPIVGQGRIEVDESLLTGEADPVPKQAGDRLASGTFCLAGSAYYRAEAVGADSMAGLLTAGARAFQRQLTPLQRQITTLVQALLLAAIYIELILALVAAAKHLPVVETVRMSVIVFGIVPIGLFVATMVAYGLGAVRLSRQRILVQRLSAVESLSQVDVLCLDKTGTLTSNTLVVEQFHPIGRSTTDLQQLLGIYLASTSSQNATSQAIRAACREWLPATPPTVREEIPFSSTRKWSAVALDMTGTRGIYVLGAPEILQPFLHIGASLRAFAEKETARGHRVLLFAMAPELVSLHADTREPILPTELLPLGLVSLRDELRQGARETLASFAAAGVRLKIISGDHPQTVAALARQVGISGTDQVVSGLDLDKMEEAQLAQVVEDATIFGRITPEQKARLVRALRRRGHYVAMTGDGVNDVLALKHANLGIALESGSQATRGIADLILLYNSFEALPIAFSEGQRIQNGMFQVLKLFLTRVLVLTLLVLAIPVVGGFPFAPKQKSLLTFLTASIISVALAVWARPGPVSRGGHTRALWFFVLSVTLTQSLVAFGVYLLIFRNAQQELQLDAAGALLQAQSGLASFLVFSSLLLIPFIAPPGRFWAVASDLSGDWRPTLLAGAMALLYVLVLALPWVRAFFSLVALDPVEYFCIGGATLLWGLLQRWIWQFHLLERFLQLDCTPEGVQPG